MLEARRYEFTAATPEEALEKGLSELNISRDQVDMEVLESGSRGLFGLGAKPAIIALTVKSTPIPNDEKESTSIETEEKSAEIEEDVDDAGETSKFENELVNSEALRIATNVTEELLEKMRVKANVVSKIDIPDTPNAQPMVMIDIQGDDLSYLIGRHSETLNALQYIVSLIVGRELGHWVPLMIDVQGYRERRERQLRQMAFRMADQVAKSGRRISLEPMTSAERRIVHLFLRDHEDIYTESIGHEPNRKVVIFPKE